MPSAHCCPIHAIVFSASRTNASHRHAPDARASYPPPRYGSAHSSDCTNIITVGIPSRATSAASCSGPDGSSVRSSPPSPQSPPPPAQSTPAIKRYRLNRPDLRPLHRAAFFLRKPLTRLPRLREHLPPAPPHPDPAYPASSRIAPPPPSRSPETSSRSPSSPPPPDASSQSAESPAPASPPPPAHPAAPPSASTPSAPPAHET